MEKQGTKFLGFAAITAVLVGLIYLFTRKSAAQKARFEVTNLVVTPDVVRVGETVEISVDVTNVGNTAGTYNLVVEVT